MIKMLFRTYQEHRVVDWETFEKIGKTGLQLYLLPLDDPDAQQVSWPIRITRCSRRKTVRPMGKNLLFLSQRFLTNKNHALLTS